MIGSLKRKGGGGEMCFQVNRKVIRLKDSEVAGNTKNHLNNTIGLNNSASCSHKFKVRTINVIVFPHVLQFGCNNWVGV